MLRQLRCMLGQLERMLRRLGCMLRQLRCMVKWLTWHVRQLRSMLNSMDKLKTVLPNGCKALEDYLWGYNPRY